MESTDNPEAKESSTETQPEQWSNTDNLTPWQPGQSGNPAGRPPNKASITYQIKKLLEAGEGIEAKELAKTAVKEAKKGSFPHLKEILERTDGPTNQVTPIGDITIRLVRDEPKALPEVKEIIEIEPDVT